MSDTTDILITGSGVFAARILFDLAATAQIPTRIAVAGRNAQRLAWLETAARARAHMFGRPVTINARVVDLSASDEIAGLLAKLRPSVILQAASLQPGSVISAQSSSCARTRFRWKSRSSSSM